MRRFNINDISNDYIAKEITKDNALDAFNIMIKYKIRNKINIPMINKGLSNPKKNVSV